MVKLLEMLAAIRKEQSLIEFEDIMACMNTLPPEELSRVLVDSIIILVVMGKLAVGKAGEEEIKMAPIIAALFVREILNVTQETFGVDITAVMQAVESSPTLKVGTEEKANVNIYRTNFYNN